MARDFSRDFYNSVNWIKCARAYKKFRRGLCENCLAKGIYTPGVIVHHVINLDPVNIADPKIALSFDNLRLVCAKCHAEEHPHTWIQDRKPRRKKNKRYYFGADGTIYIPPTRKNS